MKKIIYILCFAFFFLSLITCIKNNESVLNPVNNQTADSIDTVDSLSFAAQIIFNAFVGQSIKNKAIFELPYSLPAHHMVYTADSSRSFSVDFESWFLIIDYSYLRYYYPIFCSYVFINPIDSTFLNFGGYDDFGGDWLSAPSIYNLMDTAFVWASPQTHFTSPLIFSDNSDGCGPIYVLKENDVGTAVLVIGIDTTDLNLTGELKSFYLEDWLSKFNVTIDFYNYLPENTGYLSGYYCTDVYFAHIPPKKWFGYQGLLKILMTDDDQNNSIDHTSIILKNIYFLDENGQNEINIDSLIFDNVFLGGGSIGK